MGCDACTDKEKQQYFQTLRTNAKEQAKKEGKAIAICLEPPNSHFLCEATEAIRTGQIIMEIVSQL